MTRCSRADETDGRQGAARLWEDEAPQRVGDNHKIAVGLAFTR